MAPLSATFTCNLFLETMPGQNGDSTSIRPFHLQDSWILLHASSPCSGLDRQRISQSGSSHRSAPVAGCSECLVGGKGMGHGWRLPTGWAQSPVYDWPCPVRQMSPLIPIILLALKMVWLDKKPIKVRKQAYTPHQAAYESMRVMNPKNYYFPMGPPSLPLPKGSATLRGGVSHYLPTLSYLF